MNKRIIFILFLILFLSSIAYGYTYSFPERLSDNIWLEISKKEDKLAYYITIYWNKYALDDVLEDAIRAGAEKLEQDTGYLKKLISPIHPGISIEFTEKIVQNALSNPLFVERLSHVTKDAVRDFITRDIMASDKIKEILLEHFIKFYRAEIGKDLTLNFNTVPPIKSAIIKGIAARQGEISLLVIGVIEVLTQRISLIIMNEMAGSLIFRFLPQVLRGIVPKVIPLLGVAFFAWDLLHPNTNIEKLRDALLEKTTIQNIFSLIRKQVSYAISENLKDHTSDIADTIYKASREYIEETLESKIFGKGAEK